ncbi:helix-turn-helix transcriptional regulator [Agromyces tardus]|uniref:helix-turn-helix transcriptional regulator n=1 Tax=Agromyces tardus TaxID=2583849 RepID=UPI00148579A0|nr:helix-turn-helix domain-containing protein [Agromyces tardus]
MASDDDLDFERGVSAVSALADPLRRRVYDLVARSGEPLGHDAVAAALGVPRSTAAFHLTRLAAEGLLDVESRRLGERTGPGQGRPAKVYRRAERDTAVELPRRRYELAGHVMAEAIASAGPERETVLDALRAAAANAGARLAESADDLTDALDRAGMEPVADGDDVVLGVCPFHALAVDNRDVVCALNHSLVCGMAEGLGEDSARVQLDPGAGRCYVRIHGAATAIQRIPS